MFKIYDYKKGDKIQVDAINVLIYGEPGIGKTTLSASAGLNTIILDFDKGVHRAKNVNQTYQALNYDDIATNWNEFVLMLKPYDVIIIDTVDKLLTMMTDYILRTNSSARTNNLKAFGFLKERFELFIQMLNSLNKDIILIAHQTLENTVGNKDNRRIIPKITGSSKDLVTSVCDLIGYMSSIDDERKISFEPKSIHYGKNPTKLPELLIPNYSDDQIYFKKIIASVKKGLNAQNSTIIEVDEELVKLKENVENSQSIDELNEILISCKTKDAAFKKQVKAYTDSKVNTFKNKDNIDFNAKQLYFFKEIPIEETTDEIF